jgi:DNA-3-methyladenine glycosylase
MLDSNFFARDTEIVARELIGCRLVVARDGEVKRREITQTEAYLGSEDAASHARFKNSKRSQVMQEKPATMYVYLIYGIHHLFNIVTKPVGQPGAVLIRGVAGLDGPGKLTKELGIRKETHNGRSLGQESGVWIERRRDDFELRKISAHPRIGIEYAAERWREAKLRFSLEPGEET